MDSISTSHLKRKEERGFGLLRDQVSGLMFRGRCRRWRSHPSGKCSQERLTRGTVTSTMRRAAHPSGCARSGAGTSCSAAKYQSLFAGGTAHITHDRSFRESLSEQPLHGKRLLKASVSTWTAPSGDPGMAACNCLQGGGSLGATGYGFSEKLLAPKHVSGMVLWRGFVHT